MGQDSRTSKPVRSARFSSNVHSDDFLVLGMCVLRVNAFVENDVTPLIYNGLVYHFCLSRDPDMAH